MRLRTAVRGTAAGALASAALVLVPASPAVAAECPTTTGVTVVVDFTALGGGVATTCVEDGGGDSASDLFDVDHSLTRVQAFPGAVCRVDGAPADLACRNMPPDHYYWALFWSPDGGERTYASQGVDSLEVPDGGSVAFVFHKSDPPPSESPSDEGESPSGSGGTGGRGDSGGSSGGSQGTSGSGSPSAAPSASATPSSDATSGQQGRGADRRDGKRDARDRDDRDDRLDRKDRKEKADPEPSDTPSVTDDPSDAVPTSATPDTGQGLPAWIAPVAIAALFGLAGVVALLRRRPTP